MSGEPGAGGGRRRHRPLLGPIPGNGPAPDADNTATYYCHRHHHHHHHRPVTCTAKDTPTTLSTYSRTRSNTPWILLTAFYALTAAMLLAGRGVAGFQCGPCDHGHCPTPITCVGGVVKDPCDCCLTCARQVNESCGGPDHALGRCDAGLTCTITPDLGSSLQDANMPGICTAFREISLEQLCDLSACETGHTLLCPNDSRHDVTPAGPCCPPSSRCQCLPCDPDELHCDPGQLKVRQEKGTGLPGNCCDLYKCLDREVCSNVTCPDPVECPADSEQLPPVVSEQGCCATSTGCKCKPKEECLATECAPGQRVQVIAPATGQPGACCDKTQCDFLTCTYGDVEYQDGQTWSPKQCTTCSCQSKLVFCRTAQCENEPPPMCGWLGLEDGSQCCHVCKGCLAVDGARYANGERWEQDACTTCRCEGGVRYCQTPQCRIECAHPRKVAGRCCPVCDDKIFVTLPPHCPKDENCTLLCPNGRKQDEQGCYTCECNPEPEEICDLQCLHGYRLDEHGKEICDCAEATSGGTQRPLCPPLTRCKKNCVYGLKRNKLGCERCRCKKCPEFLCHKNCMQGYMYNSKGCKVCKCLEPEDPNGSIQPLDPSPVLPPHRTHCMSVDGRRMEDGETWYDGCRQCFCHDRYEWCSLITCPVLLCKNPVIRPADCCRTCPEDDPNALVPGEPTQCQASGGTFRTEGETWSLDPCTKCICHGGGMLCQTESCPPLFCSVPVRLPGQCCSFCPEGNTFFPLPAVQSPRGCTTTTGAKFADGDSWRVNSCQSCICHAGQVNCFFKTCPLLTCNHTLLKKGQCCPFCVEEHVSGTCRHEGETYATGQSWLIETCRQCMCDHGHVICSKLICPPPRCRRPIRIPGICCPICTNATYEPTEPSVEIVPPVTAPNSTQSKPHDIDDVPRENSGFEVFGITVGILGAVVGILILLIITLLVALYRSRRKTEAPHSISPKVTEVLHMPRPKSTNVELQGFTPIGGNSLGGKLGYDGPVVLRSDNITGNAQEKVSNLKPKMDEKAYRNSCADAMLSYNLTVPTDPNDFRKSV